MCIWISQCWNLQKLILPHLRKNNELLLFVKLSLLTKKFSSESQYQVFQNQRTKFGIFSLGLYLCGLSIKTVLLFTQKVHYWFSVSLQRIAQFHKDNNSNVILISLKIVKNCNEMPKLFEFFFKKYGNKNKGALLWIWLFVFSFILL